MPFGVAVERFVDTVVLSSCRRAIAATGVFAALVAIAVSLPRGGSPLPHVHDEASYLLAADTYAHGRLANPMHPMREFFATFHVLQEPTYSSKFPPAQGVFLAIGQVLAHRPIVGVWLSFSLMCAAFTWMLLGWLPRRWAVGASMFAALYLAGASADVGLWAAGYFGGAVAATGGALLLGAVHRLVKEPRVAYGVLAAAGLALMANSRPYEGLVASIPSLWVTGVWLIRDDKTPARVRITNVLLPAALLLGCVGAWMAYFNFRVTGSALHMPYSLYVKVDGSASPFLLGRANAVPFQNEVLDRFYRSMQAPRTPRGLLFWAGGNVMTYVTFYLPVFLAVGIACFPSVLWRPRYRLATATLGFTALALLSETWSWGHYSAPATGAFLLLSCDAFRRIRASRFRNIWIVKHLIFLSFAAATFSALLYPAYAIIRRDRYRAKWFVQRAAMIDRLEKTGRKHVIVVDYGETHDVNMEWVFNGADIDGSPVVFARSLGAARDSVLLAYFRDRRAWTLHVVDDGPFTLRPVVE